MASPPRIRVALIGLSASAATSWAARGHLPYLLSPRGLERFQIVTLCNSSVAAAHAAIAHYKLDPSVVHAHGDPASLAADADVDLVVCNTRVDNHFPTIEPSVRAGKDVFCEWPLAENAGRAKQLVELAKEGGGRTVVGLQGQLAPLGKRLRGLLEAGRIGRIFSVEVRAAGGMPERDALPATLEYFTRLEVGGNMVTIGFGHLFDLVQSVVGEANSVHGHLHLQRPDMQLRDPATKAIVKTVRSDVPDLIVATGSVPESPLTQKGGAPLLVRFSRDPPFTGEPKVVWIITGEKGEIRLTSHSTAFIALGPNEGGSIDIEVHDFETDNVTKVEWSWEDWQEELPMTARNVGALYEAFSQGEWCPTFEHALRRHEQLDGMLTEWKRGRLETSG
ncbi:oxidoreductase family protein [Mycena alexandri]|uniref:Oxidoreductase family protein n=1 Tax=Mycena alexandri TaxID=1745969 RepID=A0AAD6X1F4_9AGAR|nr:oxidoreductase family protein [Mycena alexandri]